MGTQAIDAQLRLLACLNQGPDTNCTYEFRELPFHESLEEALREVFGSGIHYRGNQPHSYSAADWHLRLDEKKEHAGDILAPVLVEWAFKMPYSPVLAAKGDWVRQNVISMLCEAFQEEVGNCQVFEIFVSPSWWYEAAWQDFAFKGDSRIWFLHFGVSD